MLNDILQIINVIISACKYFIEWKEDEKLSEKQIQILHKYEEILAKQEEREYQQLLTSNIKAIASGHTEELLDIEQVLRLRGQIDLAERVNELIDGRYRMSEASYILLESYLNGSAYYENVKKAFHEYK